MLPQLQLTGCAAVYATRFMMVWFSVKQGLGQKRRIM
jgi:hypothetical protein